MESNAEAIWDGAQISLQAVPVSPLRLTQRGLDVIVPAFFICYPFVINYSSLSAGYAREERECFHRQNVQLRDGSDSYPWE